MKTSSLAPLTPLNAGETAEDKNARPPDAAIRAISEIIKTAASSCNEMMKACRTGLNIVVQGSNPEIVRPPQQISGVNGEALSALGRLGSMVASQTGAKPQESPKPKAAQQAPKAAPAAPQDKPAVPEQKNEKPAAPPVAPIAKPITLEPVLIMGELAPVKT